VYRNICFIVAISFCSIGFGADPVKSTVVFLNTKQIPDELLQKISNQLVSTGSLISACNLRRVNKHCDDIIRLCLNNSQDFYLTVDDTNSASTDNLAHAKTRWLLSLMGKHNIILDNKLFHRIVEYTELGWRIFSENSAVQEIQNLSLSNICDDNNLPPGSNTFFPGPGMNLTNLNVEYSSVNTVFPKICEMLKNNRSLVSLRLAHNTISHTNLQLLLTCLAQNTTLTKLALGSQVSSSHLDINELRKMFTRNTTLKILSFWGNILNNNDTPHLTKLINQNTSLTHLNISPPWNLSPDAIKSLVTLPNGNTTLKILHISLSSGSDISSSTYMAHIDALVNNTTLSECFVDKFRISKDLYAAADVLTQYARIRLSNNSHPHRTVYFDQHGVRIINEPGIDYRALAALPNQALLVSHHPNSMLG
jgi:hypothetical protein